MKLTEKDRQELKLQCRMGYIIGGLFVLLLLSFFLFYHFVLNYFTELQWIILIPTAIFIGGFLIMFLINRKYYIDLRNERKEIILKVLDQKIETKDYEPGSGGRYREMNSFMRYDFIVDNVRYRVDKELFEKCEEGEMIEFNSAKTSNHLLGITKSQRGIRKEGKI